ncbi:hypothetical protein EW026_g4187 [Hermanssonia centrifuga]|uniref:Uncharacterized protein n=1 Tax=Hermanssonia centrifuga TaxID=98765 RepID=A0A4S4KHW2_9APHY|nr:hypothetical protein EW026_g4187 [Hermanssonia centrifuga]
MLDSIHSPMKLPVLNKLHVTVSQNPIELQLATKFFSSNVTHFVADISRGYASATGRRHHARIDSLIPVFRDPLDPHTSTLSTAYPLDEFFAAVHQRMPHIRILEVNVRDSDGAVDAFGPLVNMLLALKELTSLSLPPYILSISLVAALSTHQTLRNIVAIGRDSTTRNAVFKWDDSDVIVTQPVARIDGSSARLAELSVTVPIHTFLPFFSKQFDPKNLTSLKVIIPGEVRMSDTFKAALSVIVDRCWSLENLTVSLEQSYDNPWCVNYDVLEPLRNCKRLIVLEITSRFTTAIDNEEFKMLVSRWPRLKHLTLDGPDAVPIHPGDQASLSLVAVVELLRIYCPSISNFTSQVSMILRPNWFIEPGLCRRMNNLRAVTLLIGSLTSTPTLPIAAYLKQILPGQCKLTYHPTVHQTAPEFYLMEWETRRSALLAFTGELTQTLEQIDSGTTKQSSCIDLLWIIDLNLSTTQLL